jgi:hypothetical protein
VPSYDQKDRQFLDFRRPDQPGKSLIEIGDTLVR